MSEPHVVISVRVPISIKRALEQQAHTRNFSNLADYHRAILAHLALSDVEETTPVNGLKTQEPEPVDDNSCPLMSFARQELCVRCPYRRSTGGPNP